MEIEIDFKKINLSPAFLKLETLPFQNMFLLFYHILYWKSDFDSNKKKNSSHSLKNMPLYFLPRNIVRISQREVPSKFI